MPQKSRWSIPIPEVSLQTFVFGSPNGPLPDKLALADSVTPDTHFLTLATYRLWSKRFALGLKKAGLQEGDRVLMFSGNSFLFPVVAMGIIMAGGVFTGANPTYVARELAHQLRDSGAKFLLSADGSLEVARDAAVEAGLSKDNIFVFDEGVYDGKEVARLGIRNWSHLVASENEARDFEWKEPANPNEALCCLNYSSGTTGVAKGVMISHGNHVSNASQVIIMRELNPDWETLQESARFLCLLPMYHAYGQSYFITIAARVGIPVYVMKRFDFVHMLECTQKYKITTFHLVPPIAVMLAKSPLTKNYDLSSIQSVGSGAAPLSSSIMKEVDALFPEETGIKMTQGWGMTETTCSILSWDPNLVTEASSGVGEPLPNTAVAIMDEETGTELKTGQRGELWARGPNIMKGYWRNPKATKEVLTPDGWLKTGDIAYIDDKGIVFIVDRMKELIKVKGLQVAPAELEGELLKHDSVQDAGVVGVTINGEEVPRGYVVLKDGHSLTEKEIREHMELRLSRHKRLVGGVVFTDSIPKNPSGKILRKHLRMRANEEVGDSTPKSSKL